jgi:hypothetical protein
VPTSPPQPQELEASLARGPTSLPQHPLTQLQDLKAAKESFESEFYVVVHKVELPRRKVVRVNYPVYYGLLVMTRNCRIRSVPYIVICLGNHTPHTRR